MLFSKIFLLLWMLLPANNAWIRTVTDQDISFLMPYHPEKIQKTINGIPSYVYQTKDLTCVFGVVCSDFGAKGLKITQEDTPRLYKELKAGTLTVPTAQLKEEKTIPYDDMIIKEIEYSIYKDNYEMTYFKRFIFRDNYVYQITIGGRTRFLDILEEGREVFFNSISFPSKEKPDTTKEK